MDPVTLSVVRGSLEQITDEMDLHLIRAALSPIISETNDCAHGIFDPETGETIAQGRYGLPQFLANMQFTVQHIISLALEKGGFHEGDVWIVNDPYCSGTHIQDVVLLAPYMVKGKAAFLLANTGHMMDLGGSVPGGWVPSAQEIHQEGTVIPAVKLCDKGNFNNALLDMILANSRLAKQVRGDLMAMLNVFEVGRRGLDVLQQKYGIAVLKSCVAEMIMRAEVEMRSHIAEIPSGIYEVEDFLDNDGVIDAPLPVRLKMTVRDSEIELDFTGTSPCAKGPMNIASSTTKSMCYVALKHLFPDVPINGGTFRPIKFVIPPHSIFSAGYPVAVGGTTDVTQRVVDVVLGAMAKALPQVTPAAPFGTTGVVTISGRQPNSGDRFVAVYPYPGGYGGSAESDGLVNGTPPGSMAKFMSVEMSEHRFPLRFDYLAIREGSSGAGLHRGGCGTSYGITALSECLVSVLGDRVDYAPFGVQGGRDAAPNYVAFETNQQSWKPKLRSKAEAIQFQAGDKLHMASPGGGGFGPPERRPVEDVLADLNAGIISREVAENVYRIAVSVQRETPATPIYQINWSAMENTRRS